MGDYLVTVSDTKTGNAAHNAAVTLHEDGSLAVLLPDGRLIDYAAQTTVTVQLKEDKSPMEGIGIVVTDKNDNFTPGKTGADGKLTVPAASGNTNSEGRITIGGTDKDGKPATLTVKVEDFESGRPIVDASVEMKNGKLHILLPDGVDMDAGNRMWAVTICVLIVIYGRMIEIYLVTSIAPIPMATMTNRECAYLSNRYF